MMKRIAVALILTVSCFAPAYVAAAEGQEEYLRQVAETNNLETLQEKYGTIAARSQYHFADGTVQSQYVYRDPERYIFELEGNVTVDEAGDVYGFYEMDKLPYRMLFTDGAYEEYRTAETLTNWESMCGLEAAGIVAFEGGDAQQTFWQKAEIDYAENGYEVRAGERIGNVFTVDDATGEITGFQRAIEKADGSGIVLQEGEILPGAERIEPDADMRDQIFSEDLRVVTLIADPGTAQEKRYEQTVGKGCMIQFFLGSGYDGQVYEDAGCTVPYNDGRGDRMSDVTVYAEKMQQGVS